MDIQQLLKISVEKKASDLHLSANMPPIIRLDGDLMQLDHDTLTHETLLTALKTTMNHLQQEQLDADLEIDYAYKLEDIARFRVNVFYSLDGINAVFRIIPQQAITLKQIDAPQAFYDMCQGQQGLILVTGPTGCGKSTTLAAMVHEINEHQPRHIITIEDPVEFVHKAKSALINQREVQAHTHSFNAALRSALREDPDVIMVGEIRDLESIRLALTAAETGHLVLSTLHTNSAASTIDRIINVFPGSEQSLIRGMLANSLKAVISQTLLKKIQGGRTAAYELLLCNHAIRNLIRENKIHQIPSAIQMGQGEGMQTLSQYIQKLQQQGIIHNLANKPADLA